MRSLRFPFGLLRSMAGFVVEPIEVAGVGLADWTEELALGAAAPAPVLCEGAGCCDDAVCDACAAEPMATRPGYCRFCMNWPTAWPECAPAP